MQKNYNSLIDNLNLLKLGYTAENFIKAASHAGKNKLDYIAYLENLISGETAVKQEKAIANRIKKARFPYRKTMDHFDWNHPDKINRMQIENLFRLDFINENKNIILIGNCGLGKSHIAIALALKSCNKGYSTLFRYYKQSCCCKCYKFTRKSY